MSFIEEDPMSFDLVARKVQTIKVSLNDWQRQALERRFAEYSSPFWTLGKSSLGQKGLVFVDCLYALLKHRDWLDVAVFRALTVEFLQLDHGLARGAATKMIDELVEVVKRLGIAKTRSVCCDDREFLTWTYVMAATAKGSLELEMEVGLGTALMRKLQDGVRALDEAAPNRFIPEYDAMLAAIIVELGHESKSRKWALDEHRLKYRLLAAGGDQAVTWVLEEQIAATLAALMSIGRDSAASIYPDLCQMFEAADLVIPVRDGRGRTAGWNLTQDGLEISAGLAIATHGDAYTASMGSFVGTNPVWQLALIRDARLMTPSFVMQLLTEEMTRLAPPVVEAAVTYVVSLGADVLEPESIQALLDAAKQPWHKAAVMRALRDTRPSDEVAAIVAAQLSAGATGSLVEAAGALMDSWSCKI